MRWAGDEAASARATVELGVEGEEQQLPSMLSIKYVKHQVFVRVAGLNLDVGRSKGDLVGSGADERGRMATPYEWASTGMWREGQSGLSSGAGGLYGSIHRQWSYGAEDVLAERGCLSTRSKRGCLMWSWTRSHWVEGRCGQGGSGGPAHLQGGTGGVGEGPIVHITTSQLIAHNLQATVATDQALQLRNIQASQIANHCPPPSRIFCGRQDILENMQHFFSNPGIQHIYVLHGLGGAGKTQIALKFIKESSSRPEKTNHGLKELPVGIVQKMFILFYFGSVWDNEIRSAHQPFDIFVAAFHHCSPKSTCVLWDGGTSDISQVSFSPVGMLLLVDILAFQGGQGGPGGPADVQGGAGGVGEGPIVHITTSQLIVHNLQATVATDQALQLRNVRASQIASHCPPPSRIFCGRQEILNKMRQFFSDSGIQHIFVLHGLGGAGKTQIALKFIKESSSRCSFSDTFFVDTSTIATIETGLKNIAIQKDFGDSPEDGLLWLASKLEEWLLFFDNADDPSINLHDYIPQCNHGNIIITSRNPGMCVYAGSNSLVSDMEEEDAVALLLKSALQMATVHTEQIAAEIVKSLHHLPLAIVQAGAFISKSRNLDSYLALYTKNQARLLSEKPAQSHDQYAWTVYTTWQMSFDRLTPPAAMFLQHCSFLHYNGISEEIFSYASKYQFYSNGPSEEELQKPLEFLSHFLGPDGKWDSLQFLEATNEVQSYSLISFDAEKKVFSIHPLVHSWSHRTVQNPEGYMFTMGSILGMAISERPLWDMQLTSLLLYPHVELAVQMNTKVAWLFKLECAVIFWEGGRYKEAEKLQEEVLEEQKQLLGENDPDTLLTMVHLAVSYSNLGEHRKAKELEVIVLEKQKQHQKAKKLKVLVLEKQTQVLGENHLRTLHTMGNLANSYSNLGEHQKAKELQVPVLAKQKQILGENHPHTLLSMGDLATSYSRLGEHQNAKELEVIVLEKRTQVLGENHPDTLFAMGNLANSYSNLGEYQNAKELEVIVLEKQTQVLGENHPDTLRTMGSLAVSYSHLGKRQKAKELQVIVLEKRTQVLGENHPDTLFTMGALARSYSHLGECQQAKELMVFVLEKQTQVLGENHPDTLRTMGSLAVSYSDLGEHQKAKELKVIVLEKQTQVLGENHPNTLHTMGGLAVSYSDLGEHQKAKELRVLVLEKRKQVLGDNHPDTLEIEELLDSM
ncbi:hypothetical protein B0H16DRAFT_1687407 [Mycena metata]|uniref:DUF7779 domain-containing protein n=1 Tax=Mycena metata TaxID=1033252 RepID=A0AAD7NL18_9AGAR|nr:hypothetical protein B0H16DRAFT_1687407 [Mycena metata]